MNILIYRLSLLWWLLFQLRPSMPMLDTHTLLGMVLALEALAMAMVLLSHTLDMPHTLVSPLAPALVLTQSPRDWTQ